MKKYYICFFLLAVFLAASILTGAYIYFYRPEHAQPVPGQILESESAPEDNVVINQRQVETKFSFQPDPYAPAGLPGRPVLRRR